MGNVITAGYIRDKFLKAMNNEFMHPILANEFEYHMEDWLDFQYTVLDGLYNESSAMSYYSEIDTFDRCLRFGSSSDEIDIDVAWTYIFDYGEDDDWWDVNYTYIDDYYMVPNIFYTSNTNNANRIIDTDSAQTTWDNDFHILCTSPHNGIHFYDMSETVARGYVALSGGDDDRLGGYTLWSSYFYDYDYDMNPETQLYLVLDNPEDKWGAGGDMFTAWFTLQVSANTALLPGSYVYLDGGNVVFEATSVRTGSTGNANYPVWSNISGYIDTSDYLDLWKNISTIELDPIWEEPEPEEPEEPDVTWTLYHTNTYVDLGGYNVRITGSTHSVTTYQNCPIFDAQWNIVGYGQATSYTNSTITFKITGNEVSNMKSRLGSTVVGWIFIGIPFTYGGYTRRLYLDTYIASWSSTSTSTIPQAYIDITNSSNSITFEDWRDEGGMVWFTRTHESNDAEMYENGLNPGDKYSTLYFPHKFCFETECYDGQITYSVGYYHKNGYWISMIDDIYDDNTESINLFDSAVSVSTIQSAFAWLNNTFGNRIRTTVYSYGY